MESRTPTNGKGLAVLMPLFASLLLSACATSTPPPPPAPTAADMEGQTERRVSEADKAAAEEYKRLKTSVQRQAYSDGVKDTMEEFKMRMQGRQNFVYQPPIIDYVQVPGAVVNGAYIPAHMEAVIVSPGYWVEENGVQVPAATTQDPRAAGNPQ